MAPEAPMATRRSQNLFEINICFKSSPWGQKILLRINTMSRNEYPFVAILSIKLGSRHSVKSKNVSVFLNYTFVSGNIASKVIIVFFFLFNKGRWGWLDERMANLFIIWGILSKHWVNFDSNSDRCWKNILRQFEGTLLFNKIRQESEALRTSIHVCFIFFL